MSRIVIDFGHSKGTIAPEIYGHFAEHIGGVFYDGLWVGEDSEVENIHGFRKALVESFRKINPPVVRWPGGCFAETYDWRDGIGPRDQRPKRINWWHFEDGRMESNQVGTHEFMDFCKMVGAEPYVAANITSTTPLHIRNWVEYCNYPSDSSLAEERGKNGSPEPFNVRYWGIGNENWGGGGQMSPEWCAREYLKYSTIFKPLGTEKMRLIMCGATSDDTDWTRRIMREWAARGWKEVETWGLSLHYYTNYIGGSDDCFFTEEDDWYDEIFRADHMAAIVDAHRAAMDEFDPERKLKMVVDEWGNWHKNGSGPSKGYNLYEQQSTMRDAMVTALTLNIFNNRCDFIGMTNVAQLCNNLHCLYLAGGNNFVETPTYHVYDMYKGHQGGKQYQTIVHSTVRNRDGFKSLEEISAAASVKDGVMTLTLANLNLTEEKQVVLEGIGGSIAGKGTMMVLSAEDANTCNTFEDPFALVPEKRDIELVQGAMLTLPAAGVVSLTVKFD